MRVSTLLFGREARVWTYGEIGVSDQHHPLSHHRNLPDPIEKTTKINSNSHSHHDLPVLLAGYQRGLR